jgi:hypothetical protein
MRLSTRIRKGGLKELVLLLEESGQLREWRWGVFHLRGHKDVPLVTLMFHHRRIRRWSYARSVTVYTRDLIGWQTGLAIMRLVWSPQQGLRRQGSCSETFGASSGLRACSKRAERRIRSSDRYCPYTWI